MSTSKYLNTQYHSMTNRMKGLADPVRMAIILLLISDYGEEEEEDQVDTKKGYDVAEIQKHLSKLGMKLEQPTISHHLRILRDGHFIGFESHGLHHYYTIICNYRHLYEFLHLLKVMHEEIYANTFELSPAYR